MYRNMHEDEYVIRRCTCIYIILIHSHMNNRVIYLSPSLSLNVLYHVDGFMYEWQGDMACVRVCVCVCVYDTHTHVWHTHTYVCMCVCVCVCVCVYDIHMQVVDVVYPEAHRQAVILKSQRSRLSHIVTLIESWLSRIRTRRARLWNSRHLCISCMISCTSTQAPLWVVGTCVYWDLEISK